MGLELNMHEDQIPVLNKGFVRLIQIAGDDQMIVDAARVSYGRQKARSEDAALIDYLMEMHHTSPFEMVELWFHIKMPIFVARQWVRHRTASLNEVSGRYTELPAEFFMPDEDDLRVQDTVNRQGSGSELIKDGWKHLTQMDDDQRKIFSSYKMHLDSGMSKEIARINLPLSTYTEMYWKIDLNNFFRMMQLRLDSHAQKQIRVYAEAMMQLVEPKLPYSVASFRRHRLEATTFSADEMRWLKEILMLDMTDYANQVEVWKRMGGDPTMRSRADRKRSKFFQKLGIPVPTGVE